MLSVVYLTESSATVSAAKSPTMLLLMEAVEAAVAVARISPCAFVGNDDVAGEGAMIAAAAMLSQEMVTTAADTLLAR